MKIYVASSWKNQHQPKVVEALRLLGHDVYDFRQPVPGNHGFNWKEIDGGYESWTPAQYARALESPMAMASYKYDMGFLLATDLIVLVMPSGRSAAYEYGHWRGRTGKDGILYIPEGEKFEPELMFSGSEICDSLHAVEAAVMTFEEAGRRTGMVTRPSREREICFIIGGVSQEVIAIEHETLRSLVDHVTRLNGHVRPEHGWEASNEAGLLLYQDCSIASHRNLREVHVSPAGRAGKART